MYYQLKIIKDGYQSIWDHLIEENESKLQMIKPKIAEEIAVLRFHMGVQSEYCHISNY